MVIYVSEHKLFEEIVALSKNFGNICGMFEI